jgi:DNA-binding response OmpR family regulator
MTGRENTAMTALPSNGVPSVSASLSGLRILVLEDEFLIAMDVEQICRDNGAGDVLIVDNLTKFEHSEIAPHFDAAIVDLMLGGVSTLGFAQRLRAEGVPFVFASGYAATEEIKSFFPEVVLVEKPYSGDDLVAALAAACKASPHQSACDVIT